MVSHPRDLEPISIEHFFVIMLALAVTLLVLLFIIIVKYEMRNRSFLRSRLQAGKQSWIVVSYGTLLHTASVDPEMAVAEEAA
jgi:hypothetical protein